MNALLDIAACDEREKGVANDDIAVRTERCKRSLFSLRALDIDSCRDLLASLGRVGGKLVGG
jgi:hypothetical protein